MSSHATHSPSGASRWMPCPGSIALTKGMPDEGSVYAEWGTAAHSLAEVCLTENTDPAAYEGRVFDGVEVDGEMVECVKKYADYVRGIGGELLVEQRLPINHITGEEGAGGTADAIIAMRDELIVIDLKTGRGVKVDAEDNEQLQIYALSALDEYSYLGDFKQIRMGIVQPRLDHVSESVIGIKELRQFGVVVAAAAEKCRAAVEYHEKFGELHEKYLQPGDKQCRFCKAKATCPALAKKVQADVGAEFEPLGDPLVADPVTAAPGLLNDADLATKMQAVDLIEDWCKAVRAEVERRLLAGVPVPGYKLVEGRRGSRSWASKEEAEATLKSMRLKVEEMYDLSLISPTSAEKLAKAGTIGPRQWPKLQGLITQSNGKPSVAPESDKRPALVMTPPADEFDDLTTADDLV